VESGSKSDRRPTIRISYELTRITLRYRRASNFLKFWRRRLRADSSRTPYVGTRISMERYLPGLMDLQAAPKAVAGGRVMVPGAISLSSTQRERYGTAVAVTVWSWALYCRPTGRLRSPLSRSAAGCALKPRCRDTIQTVRQDWAPPFGFEVGPRRRRKSGPKTVLRGGGFWPVLRSL